MSTVRERKSARKPSLKIRATSSNAAVSSATMHTSAMYCSLPGTAARDNEAEKMAAVAESAATTRWRDDPNVANPISGSSRVYSPVTTGVPAMRE